MNVQFSFRFVVFAVVALTALSVGLSASAAPPVPFRGSGDIVVTGVVDTPPIRRLTGTATGQATHLGHFTRTESLTVNLLDGSFTGRIVFTAANGDRLNADVEGQFTSPTTAEGRYLFRGGSGRFEDAAGEAKFEAEAAGAGFDVKFRGTIQY